MNPEFKNLTTSLAKFQSCIDVKGFSDTYIKSHIQEHVVPQCVLETVTVSDRKRMFMAELDGDVLRVYLPQGWEAVEVKEKALANLIDKGLTEFRYHDVCSVTKDPSKTLGCMWLIPIESNAKTHPGNAVLPNDYAFDRPFKHHACSNPSKEKNGMSALPVCEFLGAAEGCSIYEPSRLTDEPVATYRYTYTDNEERTNEVAVVLGVRRNAQALAIAGVVAGDGEDLEVLLEVFPEDNPNTIHAAGERLDGVLSERFGPGELRETQIEVEKNGFFTHVFG